MDSLIHYRTDDIVRAVGDLYARARVGVVFTYAPKTPLLTMMHWAGRLFPRADRAPDIVPVAESLLRRRLGAVLDGATLGRSERINASFYTSCTFEVLR
jgi:magnesium-protoporphyrin O-methyltransferase